MIDGPNPLAWDAQLLSYWFSRNPAFFQDFVLRHREVGRAKDLPAPLRTGNRNSVLIIISLGEWWASNPGRFTPDSVTIGDLTIREPLHIYWWSDTDRGKRKNSEKILPHCHSVQLKCATGVEPGPSRRETVDYPPDTRHDINLKTKIVQKYVYIFS
jgi:hypothetical protein